MTMKDATKAIKIIPLLEEKRDVVEYYFQSLYKHDTLKYRFGDIEDPDWSEVVGVIERMGTQMFLISYEDRIAGEFSFDTFLGLTAQLHFSMHPETNYSDALKLTTFASDDILNNWTNKKTGEPWVEALWGLIPNVHRVSIMTGVRSGFKKQCVLPKSVRWFGEWVDSTLLTKRRVQ